MALTNLIMKPGRSRLAEAPVERYLKVFRAAKGRHVKDGPVFAGSQFTKFIKTGEYANRFSVSVGHIVSTIANRADGRKWLRRLTDEDAAELAAIDAEIKEWNEARRGFLEVAWKRARTIPMSDFADHLDGAE